jgi:hypothetical protein
VHDLVAAQPDEERDVRNMECGHPARDTAEMTEAEHLALQLRYFGIPTLLQDIQKKAYPGNFTCGLLRARGERHLEPPSRMLWT